MRKVSFTATSEVYVLLRTRTYRYSHSYHRQANILIDDDHNARLADVGVIEITDQARDYPVLDPCGTAAWQAPERLDPEEFGLQSANPTSASDIYAFGSVCVEVSDSRNCIMRVSPKSSHSYTRVRTHSQVNVKLELWPEYWRASGLNAHQK